jgi:hypothetical protein
MFALGTQVELIIDRFSKATKKIYQAEEYSRTDTFNNHPSFNVSTVALSENLSMREVLPIQAADLLVWELRKSQDKYDEWFDIRKKSPIDRMWIPEQHDWAVGKWGKLPTERKSLLALHAAYPNEGGAVISYRTLVSAERYHPNGWGHI